MEKEMWCICLPGLWENKLWCGFCDMVNALCIRQLRSTHRHLAKAYNQHIVLGKVVDLCSRVLPL